MGRGGGVAGAERWVGESSADVSGAEMSLEEVGGALVAARSSARDCLCAYDVPSGTSSLDRHVLTQLFFALHIFLSGTLLCVIVYSFHFLSSPLFV